MKKQNLKISYDKESRVFSVEIKKSKSVDSEICDNVIIDYDGKGKVVRVNFYDFNFSDFKNDLKKLKNVVSHYKAPLLVS